MMQEEKAKKIIECLRTDNATAFGYLADAEVFSAVFDRFPILSLCYLFGARKIEKKFLSPMLRASGATPCGRFPEADERFIKAAGKCARHFLSERVDPLEMLAILGEKNKLIKLYRVYPRAEKHLNAISRIYFTRVGENVVVKGNDLILPEEGLSFAQRKRTRFAAALFLLIGVFIAAVTLFSTVYFGVGFANNAYKVRRGEELIAAMDSGGTIRLERSISIDRALSASDAKILGNGMKISLHTPLCDTFTGQLQDVIIYLEKDYSGGAIIGKNKGTLRNVALATAELNITKQTEFQSLLADENDGLIEGCIVMSYVTLQGDSNGNCYFGAVCGANRGTINNCRSEGIMNAENVDLGGICGINEEGGIISDCFVSATLSQTSALEGWNPNVGGICAENAGAIYNAENVGAITSILTSPKPADDKDLPICLAAGVVCNNTGSVRLCVNKGAISASVENGHSFAGGVASRNLVGVEAGAIEECVSEGAVSAFARSGNAYAGGIAGWNSQWCRISKTRQSETVRASCEEESLYAFVGGIAGYSAGGVEKCVYTASVQAASACVLSGAICGLVVLHGGYFSDYTIYLGSNGFLTADGVKTSGSVLAEYKYRDLDADVIFSQFELERQAAEAQSESAKAAFEKYYLPLLSYGATAYESIEKIKEAGIYYE